MRWSKEEDDILKKYYGTMTLEELRKKYFSNSKIQRLKDRACNLSLKSDKSIAHRKYKVNQKFFDKPTIENSYWAGFIAADGYITKNGKSLTFSLSKKDEEILIALNSAIKSNYPIYQRVVSTSYKKNQEIVQLCIRSSVLCKDLEKNWNITNKKSLTLKPPELKNELALAFIVGYIDGDGWFGYYKSNGKPRETLGFCGTLEMVNWIQFVLKEHLPDLKWKNKPELNGKSTTNWKIRYCDRKATTIRQLLLNIEVPYRLLRKWEN